MSNKTETRINRLVSSGAAAHLSGGLIGLEKESLRVSPQGRIAQTGHFKALGAALTHPYITTDYSEALLEFITPPLREKSALLAFLGGVHKFAYENIGDELLWATSMPCVLEGSESIPIARYGSSNLGMMKTVYRRGLGHRYGHVMQVIAGVHFNYSLPEAFWPLYQELEGWRGEHQALVSESYMGMIRNLQRFGWMIPYLFGASPAVCKSFLGGQPTDMQAFDDHSFYYPYATSLRLGDIGYQNSQEAGTGIKACYDSLDAYIRSLTWAIETPCPEYEAIGVEVDGRYQQLNANVLQIENEYYSSIRPKQPPIGNEKPTLSLRRRGINYVELRSLDVNALHPLGVTRSQLYFLEAFLIGCMLTDSPLISSQERREIDRNQLAAAHRGRDPKLRLERQMQTVPLRAWAEEILDTVEVVCEILDTHLPKRPYSSSLQRQRALLADPDSTLSARMLADMRECGEGFYEYAWRLTQMHRRFFKDLPLSADIQRTLAQEATLSHDRQALIEAAEQAPFKEFLASYFTQK